MSRNCHSQLRTNFVAGDQVKKQEGSLAGDRQFICRVTQFPEIWPREQARSHSQGLIAEVNVQKTQLGQREAGVGRMLIDKLTPRTLGMAGWQRISLTQT